MKIIYGIGSIFKMIHALWSLLLKITMMGIQDNRTFLIIFFSVVLAVLVVVKTIRKV